jgi:hypothetical protein
MRFGSSELAATTVRDLSRILLTKGFWKRLNRSYGTFDAGLKD